MSNMSNEVSELDMPAPFAAAATPASITMPDSRDSLSEKSLPASLPQTAMMPGSILKIPVAIQVVIGSARLPLSQVAQLGPGAMITLDQKLGTPATILVNGKEVAKGELFVLDGEGDRLGITITEVTSGGADTAD
jgi:flagellar motor switch protein FliN